MRQGPRATRRIARHLGVSARKTLSAGGRLGSRLWRTPDAHWNRVGVLSTIIGTVAALIALAVSTQGTAVRSVEGPGEPSRALLLEMIGEEAYWYPANGQLPSESPPEYDLADWRGHCDAWSEWLWERGGAPLSNGMRLGVTAPHGAPVTIKKVETHVFARRPMQGDLIACTYGAGGEDGATIFPDLDDPKKPVSMDTDGDGSVDAEIPGGRFVVKPGEFESLTIRANAAAGPGYVYEIGFTFHVVIDGQDRTEDHGTREAPIRMAFVDLGEFSSRFPAFDWDPASRRWIPVEQYLSARQAEEQSTGSANESTSTTSSTSNSVKVPCGLVKTTTGNPAKVSIAGGAVSCSDAIALVHRYYNDPDLVREGSGGYAEIDGWACISTSGAVSEATGHYGECSGSGGEISMDRP
jgi:hypothetical protein